MEDKLKEQIEKVVAAIFASKEEDTKRKKTEDALTASATKLTDLQTELATVTASNQEKSEAITALEEQVKALQEEKAALEQKFQEEITAANEAKAAAETEFEKLNTEYSSLKLELLADSRMAELTQVGVVREDASIQRDRVKVMSDEDFVTYKEELVAVKAQVVASLNAQKEAEAAAAAAAAAATEEAEEVVVPANVDTTKSAQAALNLETTPSQDLISKYKDLGDALAKSITKK